MTKDIKDKNSWTSEENGKKIIYIWVEHEFF